MSESKRRRPEEQLEEINKKIEQMKARKQKLQSQLSQKERKERTRRLIQVGAIFEKYFETQSIEEAEVLVKRLQQFPWKEK